jgi:hypothetical protein
MTELAPITLSTNQTRMEIFAWEVIVQIKTLFFLRTTFHHPEFAKLHFPWWCSIMGEITILSRFLTLSLHKVSADNI